MTGLRSIVPSRDMLARSGLTADPVPDHCTPLTGAIHHFQPSLAKDECIRLKAIRVQKAGLGLH